MAEERDDASLFLDQRLEDRFFRALLHFPKLAALLKDKLRPEDFSTTSKANLYRVLTTYYEKYGAGERPDTETILLEAENVVRGGAGLGQIERQLKKLERMEPPQWNYILAKIEEWVQSIALRKAMFEADRLLVEQHNVAQAREAVLRALRSGGVLRAETRDVLAMTDDEFDHILDDDQRLVCKTMIHGLDEVCRGVYRRQTMLILAPLNVGKSFAACHIGGAGLFQGKGVLHCTNEMERSEVIQRYLMHMTGLLRPYSRKELEREVELWDEGWQQKVLEKRRTLNNLDELMRGVKAYRNRKGHLSIVENTRGQCTIEDIERGVLEYEAAFDNPPDIVVVDGLSEMHYGGRKDVRFQYNENINGLIKIAKDHHAAMVVTHQGNRDSLAADVVTSGHASESLDIIKAVDTAWSINQTRREYELGLARLFVMRARHSKKWEFIELFQNYTLGQFAQVSRLMKKEEFEAAGGEQPEGGKPSGGKGLANMPDSDRIRDRLRRKRFGGGSG